MLDVLWLPCPFLPIFTRLLPTGWVREETILIAYFLVLSYIISLFILFLSLYPYMRKSKWRCKKIVVFGRLTGGFIYFSEVGKGRFWRMF